MSRPLGDETDVLFSTLPADLAVRFGEKAAMFLRSGAHAAETARLAAHFALIAHPSLRHVEDERPVVVGRIYAAVYVDPMDHALQAMACAVMDMHVAIGQAASVERALLLQQRIAEIRDEVNAVEAAALARADALCGERN